MKKAFTLIELLVVVLIIGILAAIALPQYTLAVEKSRAAEAMANIATIKQQMQLYIMENGLPTHTVLYEDFASVDLCGGEWNYSSCETKNFNYYLVIQESGAHIELSRKAEDYYTFFSSTFPQSGYNEDSPVGGWYNSCITQENDIGRKICKQYEGLGWKYIDSAF